MNTKVIYYYTPCKHMSPFPATYVNRPTIRNEVVVAGTLAEDQIQKILSFLEYGESFIPRQVGLPEMRLLTGAIDPQVDHAWFTMRRNGFSVTTESPTIPMTALQLLENFIHADDQGWDPFLWDQTNQ